MSERDWTWHDCLEEPDDVDIPDDDEDDDEVHGERFGFGVCVRRTCIEPCGRHGGCARR